MASRRATGLLLSTAAVVGIVGGVVAAVGTGGSTAAGAPPPKPTSTPTSTTTGPPGTSPTPAVDAARVARLRRGLLWAEPGVIHDGSLDYRWDSTADPIAVQRARDGHLVATAGEGGSTDLTYVPTEGAPRRVARVSGTWDLDERGTRVTGQSVEDRLVSVWSLDGEREAAYDVFETDGTLYAGWSGGDVAFARSQLSEGGLGDPLWAQTVWNPADDTVAGFMGDQVPLGFEGMRTSPDGRYAAGAATADGVSRLDVPNPCLGLAEVRKGDAVGEGAETTSWTTCDWVPPRAGVAWSRDGRRVLAAPARSGPRPRAYGLLDSLAGAGAPVVRVGVPPRTTAVAWTAEPDALYASSRAGGRTVLSACTADGCVPLVRSRRATVLGDG